MAVPTIIGISPDTGPSVGANRIVITGTNFKIPTIVLGTPSTSDVPTVSVTFDGRECPVVKVLSDALLEVTPPWFRSSTRTGSPPSESERVFPVDVVVSNLTAGVVILGETVTESDGDSYTRWVLGPPEATGAIVGAVEAWIERLRREVCRTVAITRSAEFAEGAGIEVDPARLPSVNMGLRIRNNRQLQHENQSKLIVQDPNDSDRFFSYEGLRTYDMIYTMILAGMGLHEAIEMSDAMLEGIEEQPYLYTPADTLLWPDREYEKNSIFVTREPEQAGGESSPRMVAFTMEVTIEGLRVKPRKAREKLWAIDQFTLWDSGQTLMIS